MNTTVPRSDSNDDSVVSSWFFGPYKGGITTTFGPAKSTIEFDDSDKPVTYGPYANGTTTSYSFETTIENDEAEEQASKLDNLFGPYQNGTTYNFVTNKHT